MTCKSKFNIKAITPWLTAFVLFISVSLLYFAPILEGKVLQMHDITQYKGMTQDINEHRQAYNEDPQWAGRMFSGMPAYLINVKYDSMIIKKASGMIETFASPASLIFLAMLGFFIMVVLCGMNPWVGLVPSLAYGLSTYFLIIIGAGHITKMVALAYAPMMLGAVFYTYRKNIWIGAALTALFTSIEIAANHPQITYYFAMVLLAFWINEAIQAFRKNILPRFFKATGLLLIAAALAVGSNLISLYNIQTHTKETIRGKSELKTPQDQPQSNGLDLEYATSWSYGISESMNLFIPNFRGGSSDGGFKVDGNVAQALKPYNVPYDFATHLPAYWGKQPMTAGPTYIGAVIIFLCVLGMFMLAKRYKIWVMAIMLIALMLSWGSNFIDFTKLFFYYFPAYSKFRTVSMILVIVQWAVPFLAMMIIAKLCKGLFDKTKLTKAIVNTIYITGGTALFFALFGRMTMDFIGSYDTQMPQDVQIAMKIERGNMLASDSWRSFIFVALTAGSLFLFTFDKIKRSVLVLLLAILVCADLIPVNSRFMSWDKFVTPNEAQIKPTQADLQILKDTTLGYRVLNNSVSTFNDATTSYFHRSVGGYHGAKLRRYQDLIDRHLSHMNWNVYNMLNTKYIISLDQQTNQKIVHLNDQANGAAWFVKDIIYVNNPDAEIDTLSVVSTKTTAIVDKRFQEAITKEQSSETGVVADKDTIALVDYKVNHLTYKYNTSSQRIAVFSEIYYDKGWNVTIDGKPASYFRADYVLRAMVLPAGEHTVEFSFRIPNFDTLSTITLISSLLILLFVIVALTASCIKCKKEEKNVAKQ